MRLFFPSFLLSIMSRFPLTYKASLKGTEDNGGESLTSVLSLSLLSVFVLHSSAECMSGHTDMGTQTWAHKLLNDPRHSPASHSLKSREMRINLVETAMQY